MRYCFESIGLTLLSLKQPTGLIQSIGRDVHELCHNAVPLLRKLRKLSHSSSLMKIALATKAVSLHLPVLLDQWR